MKYYSTSLVIRKMQIMQQCNYFSPPHVNTDFFVSPFFFFFLSIIFTSGISGFRLAIMTSRKAYKLPLSCCKAIWQNILRVLNNSVSGDLSWEIIWAKVQWYSLKFYFITAKIRSKLSFLWRLVEVII